jgi:hypothetical protein
MGGGVLSLHFSKTVLRRTDYERSKAKGILVDEDVDADV